MLRRLFTVLTALSLLLCVSVTTSGLRSMFVCDQWTWQMDNRAAYQVRSAYGEVYVYGLDRGLAEVGTFNHATLELPTTHTLYGGKRRRLPVWSGRGEFTPHLRGPAPHAVLIVDHWFAAAVTGALPLVWCVRRRRAYLRWKVGRCFCCGYDLRATPGRCPECGTPSPAAR
jgi:hypothetical protein